MSDLLRHSLVIWLKILILGVTCESVWQKLRIFGIFGILRILEFWKSGNLEIFWDVFEYLSYEGDITLIMECKKAALSILKSDRLKLKLELQVN